MSHSTNRNSNVPEPDFSIWTPRSRSHCSRSGIVISSLSGPWLVLIVEMRMLTDDGREEDKSDGWLLIAGCCCWRQFALRARCAWGSVGCRGRQADEPCPRLAKVPYHIVRVMCVVVDRVRCDVRGACRCRTSVGTYVRFLCGKIEVADDSDMWHSSGTYAGCLSTRNDLWVVSHWRWHQTTLQVHNFVIKMSFPGFLPRRTTFFRKIYWCGVFMNKADVVGTTRTVWRVLPGNSPHIQNP
jgi:hypothetical protein